MSLQPNNPRLSCQHCAGRGTVTRENPASGSKRTEVCPYCRGNKGAGYQTK